ETSTTRQTNGNTGFGTCSTVTTIPLIKTTTTSGQDKINDRLHNLSPGGTLSNGNNLLTGGLALTDSEFRSNSLMIRTRAPDVIPMSQTLRLSNGERSVLPDTGNHTYIF
ncbi:hypothetical protein M758_UG039600, partial [Ceratodon purpureus]